GCSQAVNFPEVRNEIVALKKLEQEQKEVAVRISQLEEGIKQIEAQRQENAKEQSGELAKLEAEKKPILQRRNELKAASDLCDGELKGVDRRLADVDASDSELLKQITALQAQAPPPADLETQTSGISARRARLPEERAELARARLGSANACRMAKERLTTVESELSVAEKNIARIRGEFEARDRTLNESSRAQQDALKEARAQHQTVEERKNPAYLNIGRHLASQGIGPPNAPHLLPEVQRHREGVDRHMQHTAELALLSSQIDKQELRKFYFMVFSVLVLLVIILPLVFQSPPKREWLPQETDAILSLNTERFERDDLPKRWRKDENVSWQALWSSLLGSAARTPALDVAGNTVRVTRAMTTAEGGAAREFVLVEARGDLAQTIRAIDRDQAFHKRPFNGLPIWQQQDFAVARVGPRTIAVGKESEVEELVQVRLGISPDLKITGQLFDRFQALDQESALRLISRDPSKLPQVFHPIFARELLDSSQLIGLALTLQNPVKARLLLRLKNPSSGADMARRLHDEAQRWLHLENSDLQLFAQPPEVTRQDADLEVRFTMPENSARLLLERIARIDGAPVVSAP
ncbi:MAG: hypothetical protein ABJB22_07150, partial [Verrucomicrobiota bacterium]